MRLNWHRDFIFEDYFKRIGFLKESCYNSMKRLKKKNLLLIAYKLIEKIDDAIIAKEYSNSYLKRKKTW